MIVRDYVILDLYVIKEIFKILDFIKQLVLIMYVVMYYIFNFLLEGVKMSLLGIDGLKIGLSDIVNYNYMIIIK